MSHSLPNLFGRASAVEADHANLRRMSERLHQLSETPGAAPAGEENTEHLVREFGSELRAHFHAEETGGYFDKLAEQCPQLRSQIEMLRAEHLELTALIAELELHTDAPEFPSCVRALLERFDQHERAEGQLLQDFFARDEGAEGS